MNSQSSESSAILKLNTFIDEHEARVWPKTRDVWEALDVAIRRLVEHLGATKLGRSLHAASIFVGLWRRAGEVDDLGFYAFCGQCGICERAIRLEEGIKLKCNHDFHQRCWAARDASHCPKCQALVEDGQWYNTIDFWLL